MVVVLGRKSELQEEGVNSRLVLLVEGVGNKFVVSVEGVGNQSV